MPSLPTGTVTFLFTDIEGPTRLLQHLGDRRYAEVLAEHQRLLRDAFVEGHGQEVDTQGDAFLVAFSRAREAVATAVAAQQAIMIHAWPDDATLRVRMGLHTGEPVSESGRYVGLDVHRAARICSAGHGGQILLSQAVGVLAAHDLPPGVSLRDLGNHRLRDLNEPEHVLQVVHPDLPSDFPPLKSLNSRLHNLPIQLTSFIGREQDIAEVKRLMASTRLLTLTGTGGTGKTRLAVQVAAEELEEFADGVWSIELAPITDPALVPQTAASTLGVREHPGQPILATLVDYLRPKHLLLILDNCEHLITTCAHFAATLLQQCPSLRILATSREALGIGGETTWRVPSLTLPDPKDPSALDRLMQYEGLRLFVARAVANNPKFQITPNNAPAIIQVCSHLDGIPLAIELAAARVRALAVEQVAARLDDRFRLLTGGSRAALPRHQTLRAAIDWSYDLLSLKEREFLRYLSVFAGGWTLEAAETVCAGEGIEGLDVLDLLTQLIFKSLVIMDEHDGTVRYRLLETVRQYAQHRLVKTEGATAVQERHRDFFLALAEDADSHLWGAEEILWLGRLEAEHDNLRAALGWSLEREDAEAALRLAGALGWFWYRRGYWAEGWGRLRRALDIGKNAAPATRVRSVRMAGMLAYARGDLDQSTQLHGDALVLSRQLGDASEIGRSLYFLGLAMASKGDPQQADRVFEESLRRSREVADTWTAAAALRYRGALAARHEDYARARALLAESLALFRGIGYTRGMGGSLWHLSSVAYNQRNYAEAATFGEESLAISQGMRDEESTALALTALGSVAGKKGEHDKAVTLLRNALLIHKKMGNKRQVIHVLEGLGAADALQGHMQRAARLFGAAAVLHKTTGTGSSFVGPAEYDEDVAVVHAALGEAAFRDAWAAGEGMTIEQATEYALTEVGV